MAKNMHNTNFRRIDVDAIAEDQFREEDEVETPGLLGPDENEVTSLLQQNRNADALRLALKNPPLKTKNQVS